DACVAAGLAVALVREAQPGDQWRRAVGALLPAAARALQRAAAAVLGAGRRGVSGELRPACLTLFALAADLTRTLPPCGLPGAREDPGAMAVALEAAPALLDTLCSLIASEWWTAEADGLPSPAAVIADAPPPPCGDAPPCEQLLLRVRQHASRQGSSGRQGAKQGEGRQESSQQPGRRQLQPGQRRSGSSVDAAAGATAAITTAPITAAAPTAAGAAAAASGLSAPTAVALAAAAAHVAVAASPAAADAAAAAAAAAPAAAVQVSGAAGAQPPRPPAGQREGPPGMAPGPAPPANLPGPAPCRSCAACGKQAERDGVRLRVCRGCRAVSYCSVECARADWKGGHRTSCKAAQAERAASGVGAAQPAAASAGWTQGGAGSAAG
ncbi:hypothetical protein MNEG_0889, partial [Monoraphidium neglectum]